VQRREARERLDLDLPDPFPGDAELAPDLLERPWLDLVEAVPQHDHRTLTDRQSSKRPAKEILIGDGMLPHPAPEQIIEAYYQLPVSFFKLTLDYQFVINPAYNRDRGPVSLLAARVHIIF